MHIKWEMAVMMMVLFSLVFFLPFLFISEVSAFLTTSGDVLKFKDMLQLLHILTNWEMAVMLTEPAAMRVPKWAPKV